MISWWNVIQLTFQRRIRAPECEASMGYYDACLSGRTEKEELSIESPYWTVYRPTTTIPFNEGGAPHTRTMLNHVFHKS